MRVQRRGARSALAGRDAPTHRRGLCLRGDLGGFDLAELLEEDSHTNSFDLASRPVPAYPNQFGKLGELIKRWQIDRTAVWLVSAQPSRAVALLEEHDCICRFIPNSADRQAIERLIEQNTPVALKAMGTRGAGRIAASGLAGGVDHRPGILRAADPEFQRICPAQA